MPPIVTLRPIRADDADFPLAVYASTRADELALTEWSDAAKDDFVRMQFHAQDKHYRHYYPDAAFRIVECDGIPAGRLIVDRTPEAILILDIVLLPAYRDRGIGGGLLRDLLAEAGGGGKWVRIYVEQFNPARRLYERLGFRVTAEEGIYYQMRWSPPDPTQVGQTDSRDPRPRSSEFTA